jgi:hypothetical protein
MYADKYPDIKNAYGYNEAKIRDHYIKFGIQEGREYKTGCRFDPTTYANLNPDVKRVYKTNTTAITNHYKSTGIMENRVFKQV